MKKRVPAIIFAALLLTGCRGGESSGSETVPADGITMHADESVSDEYTEAVKTYFTAIEQSDFAAYAAMMHPVYSEAFGEYLKQKGSSLEENFAAQHKRFDEDGYDSWRITDISLTKHTDPDYDYFFKQFVNAGILTDAQAQSVRDGAEALEDLKFSVDVLYAGDDAPVTAVTNMELVLFKTADGIKLFG